MIVIKRDGRHVKFDNSKVKRAISSAYKSTKTQISEEKLDEMTNNVIVSLTGTSGLSTPVLDSEDEELQLDVEVIQNAIRDELINQNEYKVSEQFILYRAERTKEREKRSSINKAMQEKLSCGKIENQNANVDEHSFGGRKGEASSIWHKNNALEYMISPKHAKNHKTNRIYIHDLDSYDVGMHNCDSIPYDDLLGDGFVTRQTDVRPAGSSNTAHQLIAVGAQLQSLQEFGGVSATHLDWTMVPYIRMSFYKHYSDELMNHYEREYKKFIKRTEKPEDISIEDKKFYSNKKARAIALKLTIKETDQAVEGLYHNLNTLQSRSGNQLPFTSINYGTCTLPEGRIEIEALLKGSLKGVGRLHRTPIFPCGIFQYSKDINGRPGTPNYDLFRLALKSTSKRLYPNYANVDWSNNDDTISKNLKIEAINNLTTEEKDKLISRIKADKKISLKLGLDEKLNPIMNLPSAMFSTMGCRTANGYDINWFEPWKEALDIYINDGTPDFKFLATGQQKDGRGNICPATIILPTLAMEAKKKAEKNGHPEYVVDEFLSILETAISDCKDELIERFNWIAAQPAESAKFMYENGTMYGYRPEEGIRSALKHGTLAVGQIGLAECLQILVGCNHLEPKGMEVAHKIEKLFNDKCAEYKHNYKLNFGVYYTPAENLCFTAMKAFKKKYGTIPNVSDRDYFTNSIHIPVWEQISPFEKIDKESELTGYSNAGCITYVELDSNAPHNLDAMEQIVVHAMDKDIPYFAINVPSDTCLVCGFQGHIDNECPECHNKDFSLIEFLRRVTGYLTGNFLTAFNFGKQKEVGDRYVHSNKMRTWKIYRGCGD